MEIDLIELENVLLKHCYDMSLLKLSDKQKKKDSKPPKGRKTFSEDWD